MGSGGECFNTLPLRLHSTLKQMENDEAKIYDRYLATFNRAVK